MILTAASVIVVAAKTSAFHFDPAWIIAIGGAIGSIGWFFQWLQSRRDTKLKESTEPEISMAQAYKSGVDGFNMLVKNLRDEVMRLQKQVSELDRELTRTREKMMEVQADLASNVTENRRLRSELSKMNNMLAALDKTPDPGMPPRKAKDGSD